VVAGEVPLAVGRFGWTLVSGGLNEAREHEHGTHPLPAPAAPVEPWSGSPAKELGMSVLESRVYQAARDQIKGNLIISMMAAGVVTVPLAELAGADGTPRSSFMNQANRAFDIAEARNAWIRV
jgi:hypothetical protein